MIFPHDLQAYWQFFVNSLPTELFVLAGLVTFAEMLVCLHLYRAKKDKRRLAVAMMFGYAVIVMYYTLFSRPTAPQRACNLMPLWSYMENRPEMTPIYIENVMNIVLFMPFGFLGGFLFKCRKIGRIIACSICFSIIIEVLQYIFKKGFAEIDDVIHNTIGAIIGFMFFVFWEFVFIKNKSKLIGKN